jgi:hypothetical protein
MHRTPLAAALDAPEGKADAEAADDGLNLGWEEQRLHLSSLTAAKAVRHEKGPGVSTGPPR